MISLTLFACCVAGAQSNVAQYFNRLNTFAADFQQTVKQDGKIVQESKGEVWLKKPLKFRWNYKSPENMQLISDGKDFYHYDIDLAQATVRPIDEVASSAFVTLLNDKGKIDEAFTVKSFGAPAVRARFPAQAKHWLANADIFYLLSAKVNTKEDNQASTIVIGFSSSQELRVFYAQDNFGENTFVFNHVKEGKSISDKKFRFNPPKNVDILGQQ